MIYGTGDGHKFEVERQDLYPPVATAFLATEGGIMMFCLLSNLTTKAIFPTLQTSTHNTTYFTSHAIGMAFFNQQPRSHESPMDFEWNGSHGPTDPNSPFPKLRPGQKGKSSNTISRRNADCLQGAFSDNHLHSQRKALSYLPAQANQHHNFAIHPLPHLENRLTQISSLKLQA